MTETDFPVPSMHERASIPWFAPAAPVTRRAKKWSG